MKRIIDFDGLLEGENWDNFDTDDVRDWRAVYTELVRFKEGSARPGASTSGKFPRQRRSWPAVGIPFLEAEMKRLRRWPGARKSR